MHLTNLRAPVDFFLIFRNFLSLPGLERNSDNLIFLGLFSINFFRVRIEKSCHYGSFRNIHGHHRATIGRWDGTTDFKLARKGVRFVALRKGHCDLVVLCFSDNASEDRTTVVLGAIVAWATAVLSRDHDRQTNDYYENPNQSHGASLSIKKCRLNFAHPIALMP